MARLASLLTVVAVAVAATDAASCPPFAQTSAQNKASCLSISGCRWTDFYPRCVPTAAALEVTASCPTFEKVTAANKQACVTAGCRWGDFYPFCLPKAPPTLAPVPTAVPAPTTETPVPTSCPRFELVNDFNKKACAALGCRWSDFYPHCLPKAPAN